MTILPDSPEVKAASFATHTSGLSRKLAYQMVEMAKLVERMSAAQLEFAHFIDAIQAELDPFSWITGNTGECK